MPIDVKKLLPSTPQPSEIEDYVLTDSVYAAAKSGQLDSDSLYDRMSDGFRTWLAEEIDARDPKEYDGLLDNPETRDRWAFVVGVFQNQANSVLSVIVGQMIKEKFKKRKIEYARQISKALDIPAKAMSKNFTSSLLNTSNPKPPAPVSTPTFLPESSSASIASRPSGGTQSPVVSSSSSGISSASVSFPAVVPPAAESPATVEPPISQAQPQPTVPLGAIPPVEAIPNVNETSEVSGGIPSPAQQNTTPSGTINPTDSPEDKIRQFLESLKASEAEAVAKINVEDLDDSLSEYLQELISGAAPEWVKKLRDKSTKVLENDQEGSLAKGIATIGLKTASKLEKNSLADNPELQDKIENIMTEFHDIVKEKINDVKEGKQKEKEKKESALTDLEKIINILKSIEKNTEGLGKGTSSGEPSDDKDDDQDGSQPQRTGKSKLGGLMGGGMLGMLLGGAIGGLRGKGGIGSRGGMGGIGVGGVARRGLLLRGLASGAEEHGGGVKGMIKYAARNPFKTIGAMAMMDGRGSPGEQGAMFLSGAYSGAKWLGGKAIGVGKRTKQSFQSWKGKKRPEDMTPEELEKHKNRSWVTKAQDYAKDKAFGYADKAMNKGKELGGKVWDKMKDAGKKGLKNLKNAPFKIDRALMDSKYGDKYLELQWKAKEKIRDVKNLGKKTLREGKELGGKVWDKMKGKGSEGLTKARDIGGKLLQGGKNIGSQVLSRGGSMLANVARAAPSAISGVGSAIASGGAGMGALGTAALWGGGALAAGAAGYGVGTLASMGINKITESVTGEEGATLGGKIYDMFNGGGDKEKEADAALAKASADLKVRQAAKAKPEEPYNMYGSDRSPEEIAKAQAKANAPYVPPEDAVGAENLSPTPPQTENKVSAVSKAENDADKAKYDSKQASQTAVISAMNNSAKHSRGGSQAPEGKETSMVLPPRPSESSLTRYIDRIWAPAGT